MYLKFTVVLFGRFFIRALGNFHNPEVKLTTDCKSLIFSYFGSTGPHTSLWGGNIFVFWIRLIQIKLLEVGQKTRKTQPR